MFSGASDLDLLSQLSAELLEGGGRSLSGDIKWHLVVKRGQLNLDWASILGWSLIGSIILGKSSTNWEDNTML